MGINPLPLEPATPTQPGVRSIDEHDRLFHTWTAIIKSMASICRRQDAERFVNRSRPLVLSDGASSPSQSFEAESSASMMHSDFGPTEPSLLKVMGFMVSANDVSLVREYVAVRG